MKYSKNTIQHKWSFLLVFILLIFSVRVNSQVFGYPDSWGKSGFNLAAGGVNSVEVTYSVTGFRLEDELINGKAMKNISLPGALLFNDPGKPNLPGQSRYIAIPQGSAPVLHILSVRRDTIHHVEIQTRPCDSC
jgi:hypothetical protein